MSRAGEAAAARQRLRGSVAVALGAVERIVERAGSKKAHGPLVGMPLIVKDVLDVAGVPTTAGRRPAEDPASVAALRPAADARHRVDDRLHRLAPTYDVVGPLAGTTESVAPRRDGDPTADRLALLRHVIPLSQTGGPVLAVPTTRDQTTGLPRGIQLAGHHDRRRCSSPSVRTSSVPIPKPGPQPPARKPPVVVLTGADLDRLG